jgi:hypothetical protein
MSRIEGVVSSQRSVRGPWHAVIVLQPTLLKEERHSVQELGQENKIGGHISLQQVLLVTQAPKRKGAF